MIDLLPLADRPAFAAKLLTVWRRRHHTGDHMLIAVGTGEWPTATPRHIDSIPVTEFDDVGGPGGVLVLGKTRGTWHGAYSTAIAAAATMAVEELALATGYIRLDTPGQPITVSLAPDPITGRVPTWQVRS